MKRFVLMMIGCLTILGWSSGVMAGQLNVQEAVITTAVVERAPVDAVQSYPVTVGKLYCFTQVTGAQEETSLTHVWFWGEKEVARTTLPVRSANWRTWSVKTILPSWTGEWRVDILDAEGNLLHSLPFVLIPG